jgi:Tol biopolymer transport system component
MILGTLQYMAPEQLEGKEAEARTDLFALGAVVYEMATGRKAFEGSSQASLISEIMSSEPPSISTLQSMSPPALDHVVRTCLAKDPEVRWQSAHDVLVELKWIAAAGSQAGISTPTVVQRKTRVLLPSVLLAAVSLAFLVLAVAYFRQKPSEMRPLRFSIYPPEKVLFADLNLYGPAVISPDGSRLAFVGFDDSGTSQLWVRPLDVLAAQPLAGTSNVTYPFWSPDSRYLAFFADGKLKKVPANGGPPETLCDAPLGRGGSWGKGLDGGAGSIVFAPDWTGGLSQISATGGHPVTVTALDSSGQQESHRQPEFLPDGRHFLFVAIVATRGQTGKNGIFVGDIRSKPDPKNVRRLMDGNSHVSYAPPGYLLFAGDNNLMVRAFDTSRLEFRGEPFVLVDQVGTAVNRNTSDFSVSASGVLAWRASRSRAVQQLAWFDRSGKHIESLDVPQEYLGFRVSFSPDGSTIALSMTSAAHRKEDIWLLDLVRSSKSRFTFGTGDKSSPVWSQDGRRVAFAVRRQADYGLYSKDLSGAGNEELLLKTAQFSIPTDWSRDGRFILFTQQGPKTADMWVLPLFGDRKPVPVLQTEFNEDDGTFSPNGRWIAYTSDESGRPEIYVRSFTEGGMGIPGKWQISTAGGGLARWGSDGKELFFEALDRKMMTAPVNTGARFAAGIPVVLFDTHEPGAAPYGVRPDGQRFLIIRTLDEGAARPVNICLNWLAGMKK